MNGVLELLEGMEKVMRHQPIAYLTHRLGCASILEDLLGRRRSWPYPHLYSSLAGVIYDPFFSTIHRFGGNLRGNQSAAAAGTTTTGGGAAKKQKELRAGTKQRRKTVVNQPGRQLG